MKQSARFSRKFIAPTLVALLAASTLAPAVARPTGPSARDRQIALAVSLLMERQHISQRQLDDEISQRGLEALLKQLDPWKLYFYQSDIDELKAKKSELDDMVKRGDIGFAHTIFDRFLQRVQERSVIALQQIDAPHDFTIDETMVRDREAATYAKNTEEAVERWRKRVKYDLLTEVTDDVDEAEAKEKLRKRYRSIEKRWEQTDNDELLEMYLSAITGGFDPHSSYMSPSTLDNFEISFRLKLDGIGASLRSVDGYTEVHEIIPGGAADVDGRLKKGDQIVGVGQGTDGAVTDIVDMKLNDVVKQIRGERGTIVRLEVRPIENPKQREIYNITRDEIKLTNQEARKTIIDWGTKANGQPFRVGVVSLPSFYMDMDGARAGDPNFKSTTRDVRRLLEELNREAVDAVIVDLRFNGGGSLTEAVNMTGLFIDKGPVVQVKGPTGRTQPYVDPESGMVWSGPLVVLTNKFSASASEIFAGAIQDYGRGIVVGDESTHGKGTVQQLFDLGDAIFRIANKPNLGALKLTIQQFYRPDGDSTQLRGVVSDVKIPSLTEHLEVGEGDLDFALKFDRVAALSHEVYGMVDANLVNQLRDRSSSRITSSDEFKKEAARIAKFNEQKERETVTLNKEQFLAERAELDADKETESTLEKMSDADRPVFDKEDYYNKEALDITVDYLDLLKNNRVAIGR
jgi:carboxyl-terminal processing protease